MKLSNLASSDITTLELKHPVTNEALAVFIDGFTPDSTSWKKLEKASALQGKKQSLIIEKKGINRLELDPQTAEAKRNILIESITNVRGLDDWSFSEANKKTLFKDPKYGWMLEQWQEHLDDRSNFFGKPLKPASSGSKTSPGSTA